MTRIEQPQPLQPLHAPTRDTTAMVLFAAVGFALAIAIGAIFSSTAMTALQNLVAGVTADQTAATKRELGSQAGAINALDRAVRSVRQEVAALDRRLDAAANKDQARATDARFAKLDSDIASLSAKVTTLSADHVALADGLNTSLEQAGIEIGALRTSLRERDDSEAQQIAALTQRLDRLQHLVTARDAKRRRPTQAAQLEQRFSDNAHFVTVNETGWINRQ